MKRITSLVLLGSFVSSFSQGSFPTGITTSLSETALTTLVNSLLPSLVAKIGHITIPPISGNQDDFNYHIDNIQCENIAIGSAGTTLTPPDTLGISMASISLSCTASWGFNFSPWPHVPKGSGTADLSISKTSAQTLVVFNVSESLRPTIFCPQASLSVGEVDITFHGDAVLDWLLSLFKSQLESTLRSTLDKTFGPVVASFINEDGNQALASIPITIPVPVRTPYNISEVRYGFTAAPVVTATYLGLAIQGDVVPLGFTGIPPIPLPPAPSFDDNSASHMLVGHFTAYTLLSAAWTYLQANLLEWAIPSYDIPLGLNSTAGYGLIAPGMAAAFPGGGSVSLEISIGQVPTINITQQGIAAQALIPIEFVVSPTGGGKTANAFTVIADASFSLEIGVRQDPANPGSLVFNGTLAYLSAHLSLGNSSVGDVSINLLNGLVDIILVS